MKSRDKIAIGWADPGLVDGAFCVSLMMLSSVRRDRIGATIRVEGSGLISRQRNEIVSHFLDKTDDAWLLMLDADEELSIAAFDALVGAVHDVERPIVAGLYFGAFNDTSAYPRPVPLLYRAVGEGYEPIHDYPVDALIEVDSAGTGCLLIHRSILEHLRTLATDNEGRDWCWFNDGPIGGRWYGEDIIFCRRIKAAGFPIHAHTGAVLPHRKRFWQTERHHDLWRRAHG